MILRYSSLLPEPSLEMRDFFKQRTAQHIAWVNRFFAVLCKEFHTLDPVKVEAHDRDKLFEPLLTPYIFLSWKYHKPSFQYPKGLESLIQEASLIHVLQNRHHPEFWDPENARIAEDRDEASDTVIDGTPMPEQNLAEMVSDWAAVGWERDKKSPRSWADKNIGKRWDFGDAQIEFIYACIYVIEHSLEDPKFNKELCREREQL